MDFQLSETPIDPNLLRARMLRNDAGGFCVFEGWVRNHHLGREVTRLTYEAFARLAIKQGRTVLQETSARFDLLDIQAVHRTGTLYPGELAVWIGVSSVHRAAAFSACQYAIDHIKATVPIWKHECYQDGTEAWVDPTACQCARTLPASS